MDSIADVAAMSGYVRSSRVRLGSLALSKNAFRVKFFVELIKKMLVVFV